MNLEIQKYYQNKPKFNGDYLRHNLTKGWSYVINLDESKSIGTYCIALELKIFRMKLKKS